MHIQTDRALIPAATPSERYLQVRISAPPAPASTGTPRAAVDVALVLDRSGSMDGSKITMARMAVTHAVRLLKSDDHMAVVCYDDQVDTVLARTPASREAKALVFGRLAQVDARGSTNLSGGWLAGAHELQPAADGALSSTQATLLEPVASGVKRVLLLTDGLANAGEVDPQALAATAARLRAEGITTSTFGIGEDFDEVLLSRLATQGGGHFYYVEKAGQIPDFFASELGEALDVTARDVVFEIAGSPGVQVELLNDLPAEPVEVAGGSASRRWKEKEKKKEMEIGKGLRVRLGDLVADQELTLMLAVRVQEPPPLGAGIEVACRLTDRDHVLFGQPMFVDWAVVPVAENDAQPVNQAVLLAVATLLAERARGHALSANRRGAYDDARGILDQAMATLQVLAPHNAAVQRLIAALEHDRDEFAEAMSPLAMKQKHYVSYRISASRDSEGKATRKAKTS